MIRTSTAVQALALVAIGSLLGYAAATADRSRPARRRAAAAPDRVRAAGRGRQDVVLPESTSTAGPLLALAERNEAVAANAAQAGKKPNILVIFGDDIGITNISAYSDGLMGYETPNIDRIAKEGVRFLHYYGEQSCTAGRAAFLTGQHGIRTGLTKVGFPGAPMGMSQLDPSIGGLLKNLGYATGQFGKNHVGDRNEYAADGQRLRRVLRQPLPPQRRGGARAARLPEGPGVPRRSSARAACSSARPPTRTTRPSIRGSARSASRRSRTPAPLTKKRMETIDDETSAAAIDYMKRQHAAGKPFFCWFNATRMHLRTHVRAEHRGRYKHGDSEYIDGMIEHDDTVGTLLKALDDLGIADDTIVVYTSDNGPHMNTWPDGAMTPFRSREEHQLGGRLPRAVPGPLAGHDQAGHGDQRADEPQRLDPHALRRSRASRTSSASCLKGYDGQRQAPTRSTSTATTSRSS